MWSLKAEFFQILAKACTGSRPATVRGARTRWAPPATWPRGAAGDGKAAAELQAWNTESPTSAEATESVIGLLEIAERQRRAHRCAGGVEPRRRPSIGESRVRHALRRLQRRGRRNIVARRGASPRQSETHWPPERLSMITAGSQPRTRPESRAESSRRTTPGRSTTVCRGSSTQGAP